MERVPPERTIQGISPGSAAIAGPLGSAGARTAGSLPGGEPLSDFSSRWAARLEMERPSRLLRSSSRLYTVWGMVMVIRLGLRNSGRSTDPLREDGVEGTAGTAVLLADRLPIVR